MKKKDVVKTARDFDDIIKSGKKLKNKYYNIFYKEIEEEKTLFGLAVSKKLGNAVFRNKNKRQLRNIIDNNKYIFKNNHKYIIMIKREGSMLSFEEKEKFLIKLVKGEK